MSARRSAAGRAKYARRCVVARAVEQMVRNKSCSHDIANKVRAVASVFVNWVLSFEGGGDTLEAYVEARRQSSREVRHAYDYLFNAKRTMTITTSDVLRFFTVARQMARAVFTEVDAARNGGYAFWPSFVSRNAAYCVPVCLFFKLALSQREFRLLGGDYSFHFLHNRSHTATAPSLVQAPSMTLVPTHTGDFVPLTQSTLVHLFVRAAEQARARACPAARSPVATEKRRVVPRPAARCAGQAGARGRRGRAAGLWQGEARQRHHECRDGAHADRAVFQNIRCAARFGAHRASAAPHAAARVSRVLRRMRRRASRECRAARGCARLTSAQEASARFKVESFRTA